ncbi:MAG: ribonuclease HII [Acutalibacteraceae bacterium]|nr:ribonuclease HII [Acutalibacteraceae bacterium]
MPDYSREQAAAALGALTVCGIDEAGRGPLAGPVYAAAVVLPDGLLIEGLNDSKKLTPKKRDVLFDIIKEEAVEYGIGIATPEEIDSLNILQATFLAMNRAVQELATPPDFALVDGNRDPELGIPTETVIKGDSLSMSIAAASILAKVSRDRYMLEMAEKYPEYHFEKHKGYGTKLHYETLAEYGPSPIHRKTFLRTLDEHIAKLRKESEEHPEKTE